MAFHWRKAKQHREAGGAFDERADRRTVQTEDEVAFPVAGNSSILDLGRSFADHDLWRDELLPAPRGCALVARATPACSKASDHSRVQRAAALDEERPEMASWEIRMDSSSGKSTRSRFEICSGLQDFAHRRSPSAVTAADEAHLGAGHERTVGPSDLAGQTVLHVVPQPVVRDELRDLRSTGAPLGVPLRGRRPIRQLVAARRRVAAQLPRDRRRITTDTTADLTHTDILSVKQRDLSRQRNAQVATRHRGRRERRHPPASRNHLVPTADATPTSAAASSLEGRGRSPPRTGHAPRAAQSTADPATRSSPASHGSPVAARALSPFHNTSA